MSADERQVAHLSTTCSSSGSTGVSSSARGGTGPLDSLASALFAACGGGGGGVRPAGRRRRSHPAPAAEEASGETQAAAVPDRLTIRLNGT